MLERIKKGELNAYLGILKSVAKANSLPTLKRVAIVDGKLQATNLDTTITLKTNFAENGVYGLPLLDILKIDPLLSNDYDSYKVSELRDWPEIKEQSWSNTIDLNKSAGNKGTIGEVICHAMDFTSTDITRPALMCVWLENGKVIATDGYRAFTSSKIAEIDNMLIGLRQDTLKLLKKILKYGKWTLQYSDNMVKLEGEHATIISKLGDGQPAPVTNIMSETKTFTHRVILPYKQLKAIASKENHELNILSDGTLTLSNRPLPFKATIEISEYEYDGDQFWGVVCGLIGDRFALDVNLLKPFATDMDGNIVIRANLFDKTKKVYGIMPM